MTINQAKSAVYNLVMDGLHGASINSSLQIEQIEDEYINERLKVIEEINMIGKLNVKDLLLPLRGLNATCSNIERVCNIDSPNNIKKVEIPQIITSIGSKSINYFGSKDMTLNFRTYLDINDLISNKYKRSKNNNPYVWIDVTPNSNNLNDAFIFNAPYISSVTVICAPKDIRQVEFLGCCSNNEISNITAIDSEVIKRLAAKYIEAHRKLALANRPNDQK